MATKILVGQMAPISISGFVDAAGNPTDIDQIIAVTVGDPSKAEIIDQGGQLFVAPLLSGNAVGDGQQVIFKCDVRVGPDVVERDFIGEFDVPSGDAVAASVVVGDAVPRP